MIDFKNDVYYAKKKHVKIIKLVPDTLFLESLITSNLSTVCLVICLKQE